MPIEFPGPRGIPQAVSLMETSVLLPLTFLCSPSNCRRCLRLTGSPRLRAMVSVHEQYGRSPGEIDPVPPLRGTRVCFGPKFAIFPPDPGVQRFCGRTSGPAARQAGDARAPALHVLDDLTFRRHRMSIRMDLVYAAAKKIDGKAIRPAIPAQTLLRESTSGISRPAETTAATAW